MGSDRVRRHRHRSAPPAVSPTLPALIGSRSPFPAAFPAPLSRGQGAGRTVHQTDRSRSISMLLGPKATAKISRTSQSSRGLPGAGFRFTKLEHGDQVSLFQKRSEIFGPNLEKLFQNRRVPLPGMLPMPAPTPSPCSRMAFRRHAPTAKGAALKYSAFDLMTRSAFITCVCAEPE